MSVPTAVNSDKYTKADSFFPWISHGQPQNAGDAYENGLPSYESSSVLTVNYAVIN